MEAKYIPNKLKTNSYPSLLFDINLLPNWIEEPNPFVSITILLYIVNFSSKFCMLDQLKFKICVGAG